MIRSAADRRCVMDGEKFSELVKAYRTEMYKIAFCYTKSHADAEDVTQEAFLRLYRCRNTFPSDEECKAWLIRVTINCAKDLLKSHWYRFSEAIPETQKMPEYEENELLKIVMKLGRKYRTVLFLFYYEEYSVAEIAKMLKISQSAVTTRLSRGRNQLKKILENDKEEGGCYNVS